MQTDGIPCDVCQPDTTNGAHFRAEIASQQVFAQADALEDFRTTIRADGRDTHFRHDFLQALIHRLDVVRLSCRIVLLNLVLLHQVIQHRKGHVRTNCAGSVAQQQRRMHHFTNLAALHDEGCLHTLLHRNEVMVYGTHRQQAWDGCPLLVNVSI